jgi:hypothetical protein
MLLRKRASDTIPSMPADRSAGLLSSFSPLTTIEAIMKVKNMLMDMLHWFTEPISPACDQYVQYLLAGVNPSVLTDTVGGYHLGDLGLPHHSPIPSQSTILRSPNKGPPDLRLTIQPFSN